jgi:RHS repeat-associated protein
VIIIGFCGTILRDLKLGTDGTREYIYSGATLLAKIDSSGTKYYHQDHLSNRLLTDSSGNTAAQMGHFPYGESWYNASNDKLLFTTYERDSESGNDYAQARYNVSRLGRFSSPDSIPGSASEPQSLNRYSYVRNMPAMLTDPSGLNPCATLDDRSPESFSTGPTWGPSAELFSSDAEAPPPPPCGAPPCYYTFAGCSGGDDGGGGIFGGMGGSGGGFGDIGPLGFAPGGGFGGGGGGWMPEWWDLLPTPFGPDPCGSVDPDGSLAASGACNGPARGGGGTFVKTKALVDCVQRLFGVTMTRFVESSQGANGSFQGWGPDVLSNGGNDANITVTNDIQTYSGEGLKALRDSRGNPPLPQGTTALAGLTLWDQPYVNYTANNLSQLNQPASMATETQVHELGNSLHFITGAAFNPAMVPGSDKDAGQALENCVRKRGGFAKP